MASRRSFLQSAVALGLTASIAPRPAVSQQNRALTITTTGIITSPNPYGHSASHLYHIWGQCYGNLGRYNHSKKEYEGVLAESWSNIDPLRWRFSLRTDLRRHDGGASPTSQDVVHSWQRAISDPATQQRFLFSDIDRLEAVDDTTFDIVTKRPVAQLLSYLFDRFVISSAELYAKYGDEVDKVAPFGWGPYQLERFDVDQRIVLSKNIHWPNFPSKAPETVVYLLILEPEQRVTALLNNEVQIARLIPPQLVERLTSAPNVHGVETGSLELMFLAMNPNYEPWGDSRVRRAVAHAIDRDLIIDRLLFGLGDSMYGSVGRYQECFSESNVPNTYDPDKARALLKEAGFGEGVDIDFHTPVGRYVSDRQISEAIAQMLERVGFRVTLHAPEYANLTAAIRAGRAPFYYMGRNTNVDGVEALSQYLESGITKRIGYSNEELDAIFNDLRSEFDAGRQCDLKMKLSNHITTEAPAAFMWTHRFVHGVRDGIRWPADPTGEVWLLDVQMG